MTTRRSIALILSPVGILLISAGRLIIVANFNTTTAVTIASSGGFVNTLLGTVIPLVPVFMPYLAFLLLLFRHFLLSIMTFTFAAFITPTAITLPEGFHLAKAGWARLVADLSNYRTATIVIVLVILVVLWAYNRSFAEALSIVLTLAVALALLLAVPSTHVSTPLRRASTHDHQVEQLVAGEASSHGISGGSILVVLIILVILFVLVFGIIPAVSPDFSWLADTGASLVGSIPWLLSVAVAVIAAVALFPYIHNIYPVPQHRNYYVEATHALWLPAEKIVLKRHRIYYGYVLSSDEDWFTVLLANSRTIAYLSTDDVVGRSVCQPIMTDQPKQHPPLIPWLYHPPAHLPACPPRDVTPSITSFVSHGESLREISAITHRGPWSIIALTNAHQKYWLSPALSKYERGHDWDAPTPAGQRFWYYPRLNATSSPSVNPS